MSHNRSDSQPYRQMQEALRFYANSDNWLPSGIDRDTGEIVYALLYRNGKFVGSELAQETLDQLPLSLPATTEQQLWRVAQLARSLIRQGYRPASLTNAHTYNALEVAVNDLFDSLTGNGPQASPDAPGTLE